MATDTLPSAEMAERFHAIQLLCKGIALKVHSAQAVLDTNSDLNVVVGSLLCQVGWMADRAGVIAGEKHPVGGDADEWMLEGTLRDLLQAKGL